MQIYNTLTQQKEAFRTQVPGKAGVYVCGPTTYDYAHIGHSFSAIVYDVLVRHLRNTGYEVLHVRNVTDVDDKIIKRARERGEEPTVLSERFRQAYVEDMHRVGNRDPDLEPKVSEHIPEIVELIASLVEKGAAYPSDGDVYFHVPAYSEYGKLSHRNQENLVAGASGRTEAQEIQRKKHPSDFVLWKKEVEGEKSWPSPWGPGRPGWHIECSAMSMKYLGESFDLHGGGLDLVFPHHENEVAQSEAASGKCCVSTWMHHGFVQVNKEKMSKSLGNFFSAREVFKHVEPEALRYALLTTHYRAPFNLEWNNDAEGQVAGFPQFEEAERRLEYIYNTRLRLRGIPSKRVVDNTDPVPADLAEYAQRFDQALNDDLNTPAALAHSADLLRAVNEACDKAMAKKGKLGRAWKDAATSGLDRMAEVLGLGADEPQEFLLRVRDRRAAALGIDGEQVMALIAERAAARAAKDYERSDAIRDELAGQGVELLDGSDATGWRLKQS